MSDGTSRRMSWFTKGFFGVLFSACSGEFVGEF